jgi:transcriptional regulator with XRE-family HTH domain
MTQEATAERLGVSSHAVSMWETGATRPDQSRLPQIGVLYGVSTDHLLNADRQIAERPTPYDVTSSRAAISREIKEIVDAAEQQLTAAELRRIRDFLRFMVRQTRQERYGVGAAEETENTGE